MFERSLLGTLRRRLREPRRFLQVIVGPRQTGKTTLAQQLVADFGERATYASADTSVLASTLWIEQQWATARSRARDGRPWLLVLDEIQKIPGWSDTVKALWDADTREQFPLLVVLLGSSPLLLQSGLSESLTGRFELSRCLHWSFSEMREAFGLSLDEYVFYGAYPGAIPLIGDPPRWRSYVTEALVETTISRDILLMTRVDKPALLRQLFHLACRYSGQVLAYQKMLGQLQDAGNTTTLAHYLSLLQAAGMVCGLPKYAGQLIRQRASSPKLQVLNTALLNALDGRSLEQARTRADDWGRLVESAVGAHLANAMLAGEIELFYWRESDREVDFVIRKPGRLLAIEVKSGRDRPGAERGLQAFRKAWGELEMILVGTGGIPVEEFLGIPPAEL